MRRLRRLKHALQTECKTVTNLRHNPSECVARPSGRGRSIAPLHISRVLSPMGLPSPCLSKIFGVPVTERNVSTMNGPAPS